MQLVHLHGRTFSVCIRRLATLFVWFPNIQKARTLQLVSNGGIIGLKQVKLMENISMRILRIYEIKRNNDIILRKSVCVDEAETECRICKTVFKKCYSKNKIILIDNRKSVKIVSFRYNCPNCENCVREIKN